MEFILIGIINTKIVEDLAYSGLIIYNINDKEIVKKVFKTFNPLFAEYFSSVLFLNQIENRHSFPF